MSIKPVDRYSSKNFGSKKERLVDRIKHGKEKNLPPLIRAHSGLYQQNREEAVNQFVGWSRQLAKSGLLDVLSIGTSQLTQEKFGGNWNGLPNGGVDIYDKGKMISPKDRMDYIKEEVLRR